MASAGTTPTAPNPRPRTKHHTKPKAFASKAKPAPGGHAERRHARIPPPPGAGVVPKKPRAAKEGSPSIGAAPIAKPARGTNVRPQPKLTESPAAGDVIAELVEQHRLRTDYHGAEKRLTNQIKAIYRRTGTPYESEPGGDLPAPDTHGPSVVAPLVVLHLEEARAGLKKHRKGAERAIAALSTKLRIWSEWAQAIRGIGPLGLGQLVAEAGDVGTYANPAKLWKRMGLAVIGGQRQRRVTDAALAVEHGYSPRRRAVMFNLGEALVKQNGAGPYRTLYLERKELERARPACPTCAKKNPNRCTDAHTANRARRYMEKRFLLDLWRAWRRTSFRMEPRPPLSTVAPVEDLAATA